MLAEQLRLPDLKAPSGGPVAVVMMLKDIQTDNPKVLVSIRLISGLFGFPGGKLWTSEFRKPARGARRETRAETGIEIPSDSYLHAFDDSPRRIVAEGKERDMYMFYCFNHEFGAGARPERKEPQKHSPWRFVPIRILPRLVMNGLLHPITAQRDFMGVIDNAYPASRREKEFDYWMVRDREIDRKIRNGGYEFLDYIHDKEDGHLVF